MDERHLEQQLSDVSRYYKCPSEIVGLDCTAEQKTKLLTQWELDLRLIMNASDENMSGPQPGRTAELLTEVRAALNDLGAAQSLDHAGTGKLGGTDEAPESRPKGRR